ncbi:hypothetical protein ACU639_19875 [Streptomyces cynarae]|uniref:hypothetical protein n=1 Tax=Streptomyces cynarae TaxID=2981134 RepID=UPI00406C9DE0
MNLDTGELHIRHQLQRVRGRLLHTDTAEPSAGPVPELTCGYLTATLPFLGMPAVPPKQ